MRWFSAVVLVLMISAGLAQADVPATGYGLMLSVREMGSNHNEEALIGLAPGDFDWGVIVDPFTPVHISLQNGINFDFRPIGGDPAFLANIWWADKSNGQYELQFLFFEGGNENFLWALPKSSPMISLSDATSGTQTHFMPLNFQPYYCYGQGQSQLTVDFGSQAVPEPGSIFAVGAGIIVLFGRKRFNL